MMPYYVKQGRLPEKPHTQFFQPNGELFREELFSTHGFSNIHSNKYHHNLPTKTLSVEATSIDHGKHYQDALRQNYKLDTKQLDHLGDFITARNKIFFNDDLAIYTAKVTDVCDHFYRNAYADEVIFIHSGSGKLLSEYGSFAIKQWDYLIIPRGTIFQLEFDDYQDVRLFIIESFSMIEIPAHFRNEYGQLLETAPYCERDIQTPELSSPIVEKGQFPLITKFAEQYQISHLQWHPYDLIGWDGFVYPWRFNIQNYSPKVGKVHLPPSEHLLFKAKNFVMCNFVPRLYDFHPKAIPAPYYHNNIDCDEVLYYVDGDFMSRTEIGAGYITLHPKGITHGPQPGKTESSIGKTQTQEYAIMIDTFNPLQLTDKVPECMNKNYQLSWLED